MTNAQLEDLILASKQLAAIVAREAARGAPGVPPCSEGMAIQYQIANSFYPLAIRKLVWSDHLMS